MTQHDATPRSALASRPRRLRVPWKFKGLPCASTLTS
jgi:hypothetical protein